MSTDCTGVSSVLRGVASDLDTLTGAGLPPLEWVDLTICVGGSARAERLRVVDAIVAAVLDEPAETTESAEYGWIYGADAVVTDEERGDAAVAIAVFTPVARPVRRLAAKHGNAGGVR